jgi:hypothetical protein
MMTGAIPLGSVEQVESFWTTYAASHGFRRDGEVEHTLIEERKKLIPHVSDSRWCADCPNCGGGIACWDANPRGCCLDCGHVYPIKFPPAKVRTEAEAILLERPEGNRNWRPEVESPKDLRRENEAAREFGLMA